MGADVSVRRFMAVAGAVIAGFSVGTALAAHQRRRYCLDDRAGLGVGLVLAAFIGLDRRPLPTADETEQEATPIRR